MVVTQHPPETASETEVLTEVVMEVSMEVLTVEPLELATLPLLVTETGTAMGATGHLKTNSKLKRWEKTSPVAEFPVKIIRSCLQYRKPDSPVRSNSSPVTTPTPLVRPGVRCSTSASSATAPASSRTRSCAPTEASSTNNTSCAIGGSTWTAPNPSSSTPSTSSLDRNRTSRTDTVAQEGTEMGSRMEEATETDMEAAAVTEGTEMVVAMEMEEATEVVTEAAMVTEETETE
ncbi:UNVERIFIED_CONTAM: hypothetical protein GTU68_042064 [Idotea baltica]|nr:hypothetical protein [Idotea baltica]